MKKKSHIFFLFVLASILLIFSSPVFTEELDGRGYFLKGRLELDHGQYASAIQSLKIATSEFSLLADYALLYLSDAYHKTGDHQQALEAVGRLITEYPHSPLLKKARMAEILESREIGSNSVKKLYEAFMSDYSDDDEATLAYAQHLKQHAEPARSAALFKRLYIKGSSVSSAAYAELDEKEITAADLIERANNLIKRYDYKDAEKDLRRAQQLDNGRHKDEIFRGLGQALFKQKGYKEAASFFEKGHDLYSKARALYRSGDKAEFEKTLTQLLDRNDRRAGGLLVAAAADKRREGDFREALRLYGSILAKFPSEEEDALWGIGWTAYVSSDYRSAAETFAKAAERFDDPRYIYWQARSIEAGGGDASALFNALAKTENNFYSFMAQVRSEGKVAPAAYVPQASYSQPGQTWQLRVEALIELGMQKEAAAELSFAAKKVESQADLLYIVSKYNALGEYRKAVGIATKMPYHEKVHRLWYPLAYWNEVSSVAAKHDFDPMLALSVMREESRFDADARSSAGARGLMQLMPQTAYRLDKSLKLGIQKDSQINDVRTNINLGIYYLKSLSSEFRSVAHAIASYNAGEAAIRRWDQTNKQKAVDEFIEDIPYAETRNYVKKVLTSYFQYLKSAPPGSREFKTGSL